MGFVKRKDEQLTMLMKKKLTNEWKATYQCQKDTKHLNGITLLKDSKVDLLDLDASKSESPLESYIRKDNTEQKVIQQNMKKFVSINVLKGLEGDDTRDKIIASLIDRLKEKDLLEQVFVAKTSNAQVIVNATKVYWVEEYMNDSMKEKIRMLKLCKI